MTELPKDQEIWARQGYSSRHWWPHQLAHLEATRYVRADIADEDKRQRDMLRELNDEMLAALKAVRHLGGNTHTIANADICHWCQVKAAIAKAKTSK